MFDKVFYQLLWNAAIEILFSILLTFEILWEKDEYSIYTLLFLFIVYWSLVEIVIMARTAYQNYHDPDYEYEGLKWSWQWPPISIPNPLFGTITPYKTFHYLKLLVGLIFFIRVYQEVHNSGTRF